MKVKLNIKNVLALSISAIMMTSVSLFFMNTSFAANTAIITVETANIRETADTDATILDLVNQGESVEVLETEGEWSKVKYKNIVGYLRNDLLKMENEETPTENQEKEETNQIEENKTSTEETTTTENTEPQNTVPEENKTEIKETDMVGKCKIKEDTSLKVIPLIHALEVENVKKDTEVEVLSTINKWACIKTESKQGWVVIEKLEKIEEPKPEPTPLQTSKTMYANSETINVRSSADTNSEIVTKIAMNTEVQVVGELNGWSQVNVSGKQGYILSSLLSDKKKETTRGATQSRTAGNTTTAKSTTNTSTTQQASTTSTTNASAGSSKGANIVAYAKQFIGTKYAYGGSSPSTGFDCSGFTSYVYKHFGISLPRTSGGQAGVGTAVRRANLQPGDLAIYSGDVAIYVGGGNVIHAPRPGKTVSIVSINNAGSGFSGGRRIVQ